MMFRYASISITAIATISIGVPFVKMRKPQLKQYSFLMSSLLLQSTAYCTSVSPSPHASSEGSPRSASLSIQDTDKLSFIDSTTAKDIDDKLMSDLGFKLEQLMELAGLSVAEAVSDYMSKHVSPDKKRILIVCGPGNNGGDGLVAARHLYHFGYQPTILYLRVGRDPFYLNLVTQCEALSIPILQDIPTLDSYDLIVDALFGFSFTGPVKAPYNDLIASFALTKVPIVSVDIPSGWNVDKGDVHNTNFIPQAVVSLTAPKLCMKGYQGQHYVGGRFVPPSIISSYNLTLPSYGVGHRGTQVVLLANSNEAHLQPTQLDKLSPMLKYYITHEGFPYSYDHRTGLSEWLRFESHPATSSTAASDMSSDRVSVILSTTWSTSAAESIAQVLLDENLVACVNIVPQMKSMYKWNGKVNNDDEVLMVMKTRSSLVSEVSAKIKEKHSYDLPEILVLDASTQSSPEYVKWVIDSTIKQDTKPTDIESGDKPSSY